MLSAAIVTPASFPFQGIGWEVKRFDSLARVDPVTTAMRRAGGRAVVAGISELDQSFHNFYLEEADGVYRALALALGDADLAQEAAHEGLARAYQRWRKIGDYQSPAGWAYRVGLNWATSRLRKTGREVLTNTPERAPVTEEIDPDLRDALARLSIDARAVVVLRYLLEWPTIDTAAALGVPVGTVKSRLARALVELELMLSEGEEDRP